MITEQNFFISILEKSIGDGIGNSSGSEKMNKRYLRWYYRNLDFMKGLSWISVLLFSWILLSSVIQGVYTFVGIVIWFWGLSIANLVMQYKQK
jgi:hypothetical protein